MHNKNDAIMARTPAALREIEGTRTELDTVTPNLSVGWVGGERIAAGKVNRSIRTQSTRRLMPTEQNKRKQAYRDSQETTACTQGQNKPNTGGSVDASWIDKQICAG